MPQLTALEIVEIKNASSIYLGNEPRSRGTVVRSNMRPILSPRELDDYHLAGVYTKAGVPHGITGIDIADAKLQAAGDKAWYLQTSMISDAVYRSLLEQKAVFVHGGSCVMAPGVAGGYRRAFGPEAKLGIIWLDAHGDLNIPETSPSGMLGGMPFATVLGQCLPEWQESCGLVPALDSRLAILSDARSFDAEEAENLKRMQLSVLNTAEFCDEKRWREAVEGLAAKVDALYLHIDADIADARYLPDVNTPEPNGPDIWTLLRNIRIVMETGIVPVAALASVYFGKPNSAGVHNDGSEAAILTGIRMIGTILENWKYRP